MSDHTELAAGLRALAHKAIHRVAFGVGMTELMPEDVKLLQRAADALEPEEPYLERLRRNDPLAFDALAPAVRLLMPADPFTGDKA